MGTEKARTAKSAAKGCSGAGTGGCQKLYPLFSNCFHFIMKTDGAGIGKRGLHGMYRSKTEQESKKWCEWKENLWTAGVLP